MQFAKSIETIRINIQLKEMWIEQRIAESVAESLRRDFRFDTVAYFNMTLEVMQGAGMSQQWAKELAWRAVVEGYALDTQRKTTGHCNYHSGSGSHPRVLIEQQCQELVDLHQLLMTASYIAAAAEH